LSLSKVNENDVVHFLERNIFIKELFLRGTTFSDSILDSILELFELEKISIYIFRFTLKKEQEKYKQIFNDL
jgi:hypothetical protein